MDFIVGVALLLFALSTLVRGYVSFVLPERFNPQEIRSFQVVIFKHGGVLHSRECVTYTEKGYMTSTVCDEINKEYTAPNYVVFQSHSNTVELPTQSAIVKPTQNTYCQSSKIPRSNEESTLDLKGIIYSIRKHTRFDNDITIQFQVDSTLYCDLKCIPEHTLVTHKERQHISVNSFTFDKKAIKTQFKSFKVDKSKCVDRRIRTFDLCVKSKDLSKFCKKGLTITVNSFK